MRSPERHREVAVEAPALLRRGQRRVVGDRAAVRQPEEVEARHRHARLVGAVVEHLEVAAPACARAAPAGTSSRCGGRCPGPRCRRARPARRAASRRFGAPLRPPCAVPPAPRAPVGFSNVAARASRRRVDDGGVPARDRSSSVLRESLDHRVVALLAPTADRPGTLERDRRESGTRWPTPAGGGRSCSGRAPWMRARVVEARTAGRGAAPAPRPTMSTSVDELEDVDGGVVAEVAVGEHVAPVRAGHEPQAAVVDVGVVERHPRADRVVREVDAPVRLVLVPRRRRTDARRLEDQVAPVLDGRPPGRRAAWRRCAGRCGTSPCRGARRCAARGTAAARARAPRCCRRAGRRRRAGRGSRCEARPRRRRTRRAATRPPRRW